MNDGRVRYAGNGSVRLACRVFGEAETTVVWTPGAARNVESFDDPASPFAMLAKQLSQVTRLVVWDMRGGGLSDAATQVPPLTERVEDLRTVMDAAGVESATLFGFSESGAASCCSRPTYPHRVRSLVLYGTAARFSQELPDFPWGLTPAQVEARMAEIDNDWGSGALSDILFGEVADTPGMREWVGKIQRSMHTPTMARLTWQALMNVDIRASERHSWPLPGEWFWTISVGSPKDIPRLHDTYKDVILTCESLRVARPQEIGWSPTAQPDIKWLVRESSSRMTGHPTVLARELSGPARKFVGGQAARGCAGFPSGMG